MTTTQTPNLTAAAWRRRAEAAFRSANPDARNVRFDWTYLSRPHVGRGDGRWWRAGEATVTADGYKATTILATGHAFAGGALMVR